MGIAAGIIIILMGIAHNVYGEKKQIPALKELTQDSIMIGSLRIMIYQGGILLLAVGVVQVLVSAHILELSGIAIYFPVGTVILNVITSLMIAALLHQEIFKITIPQFVIFALVIVLQILSI